MSANASIIQSDTISQAQDGWSVPGSFQQFPPSDGTLLSVGITLTGTVTGIVAVENLGTTSETVPVSNWGTIGLTIGTVVAVATYPTASGAITLGAYDGTIDFHGTSGTIESFSNSAVTAVNSSGSNASTGLAPFVSTGTIGYTATSQALMSEVSDGNILSVTRGEAGATIDLRYDYTGPSGASSGGAGVTDVSGTGYPVDLIFSAETTAPQVLRVADSPTGWDESLTLNQFDPALGTLEAVSVTVLSDIHGSAALENLGSVAGQVSLIDQTKLDIGLPGIASAVVFGGTADAIANLAAYDGTVDFAGTSGTLVSDIFATGVDIETIQGSLSSYIGTGTTTFEVSDQSAAYLSGPADLAAELLTNTGAVLEVSYIYIPGSSVAATGSLAISGIAPAVTTAQQTQVLPFEGVSITDPNVAQTETVTITLSDPANGTLAIDPIYSIGAGVQSDPTTGTWTITGSAGDVTTALGELAFVPASTIAAGLTVTTGITLAVTDTAGSTVSATTSVTETTGIQIDTVAAAAAVQTALADTTVTQTPVISQSQQTVACFAAGTRIATPAGLVPVEDLREGDLVLTGSGVSQPINWIGRRTLDCRRHPEPDRVRPIRIARHAFGMNRPQREVYLSPDHAVYVDDVLIPVKFLLNDRTITQTRTSRVTYFHLELPRHDIVLAENLPCESYLETGGRTCFENAGEPLALHPDFAGPDGARVGDIWQTRGYAPLVGSPGTLERVQARLAFQALMLAHQPRRRSSSGIRGRVAVNETSAQ